MDEKRREAPDGLEHIKEFVNTRELTHRREELNTGVALAQWLSAHGLAGASARASRGDLIRARELREAIRSILIAHNDGSTPPSEAWETLDRAAGRARLRPRFTPAGAAGVEPEAGGVDGALGRLVAIVYGAMSQGTWTRLKACREQSCQWVFYDQTKNRSGSWCTMELCGNRAKARAYRDRHKEKT